MSGGDDISSDEAVAQNPFNPERRDPPRRTPQQIPQGVNLDDGRVLDVLDPWDGKKWFWIYDNSLALDPGNVGAVGEAWDTIRREMDAGFKGMQNGMATVLANQWSGSGAAAADQVTKAYVAKGESLNAAISTMKSNLAGLSSTLDSTKFSLPTPEEVRKYVEDIMNNQDIDGTASNKHVTVTLNGEHGKNGLTWQVDTRTGTRAGVYSSVDSSEATRTFYEGIFTAAEKAADERTQGVMKQTFDPGIQESDRNVPFFVGANDPAPSLPPGAPGGAGPGGGGGGGGAPGGGGGGSFGGASGGSGAGKVPDIGQFAAMPVKAGGQSAGGGSNPLGNAASQGMQQVSGLGQSALSQAQNAAKQAQKSITDAQKRALSNKPAGLTSLQKAVEDAKKKAGNLGKGGGGGGAGGGAKGGGGGGASGGSSPLGARATESLAGRETSLAKGLKEAGALERAMAGRGASASSGMPMGGGGAGGGRGAGGEDKEHKANKFLQTTRNGEAILGVPVKAAPVVIKE
ncbi:hypothetical protein [Gordonia soli]|uniref:PPE family domain-containing protein n=1 Tax=Gordonia soli NBRC 108243 TaxID=1223545 RepID=M0QLQ9_9ACTN|nr:hypothetical protein [Gordonia soli]GAC69344.1 hypothetical protein GS4_23_01410 [Gordonia soli NBRC 108243]